MIFLLRKNKLMIENNIEIRAFLSFEMLKIFINGIDQTNHKLTDIHTNNSWLMRHNHSHIHTSTNDL